MPDPAHDSDCCHHEHADAQKHAELHEAVQESRREFLKGTVSGGAVASLGALAGGMLPTAQAKDAVNPKGPRPKYHYVPATDKTVHWGYFSKSLKPVVEVDSGDFVTIEALTHHANDDAERMIKGDPGATSVFYWDKNRKGVDRRGAGPMKPTLFGRGAGEGLGVHICTGPVYVRDAEPGDILEVRILDVKPRPCANPAYAGKTFGSNAAAWWGFHYKELITDPKPREVITIYEIDTKGEKSWASAVYNWRVGKGATMYYPVAVKGALFSAGDSHASQGDSELCGTAIECSLTGTFQLIVRKQATLKGTALEGLDFPLLETQEDWCLHGFSFANYLAELGKQAQSEIYKKSSIDLALRDAFRKMRRFLMTTRGLSEDEAISLMSVAVDFGVTQVVDGNWGIHAIIKKSIFAGDAG